MPSGNVQRAGLHKTLWKVAEDLRGSVDGWDFKIYVLGTLFYRFISENLTNLVNENERRFDPNFDYAQLSDRDLTDEIIDELIDEKGFYIAPSELFCNVVKTADINENLNEDLERIFKNIEGSAIGTDAEADLKGLFADFDVNSNKLGNTVTRRNKTLAKLLKTIDNLQLGSFADNTIDVFGDAYEYLMGMYAANAGKSGGEYFTPQEVSFLLASIAADGRKRLNKVYDPCAGSGSLLLKFAKVVGKDNVERGFYGQELNPTTYNLARFNMFLHDVNFNRFDIRCGDTLTDPLHVDDEPFDAIVSNPPYSTKWAGKNDPVLINDPRFSPAGVLAPPSKADLAFTMHMLSWLSERGTAAIVEFPGVMYRGGAEKKIREYLIENNFVEAVIQLPPDLFFGTTIATCILVLKRNKRTQDVVFVDGSREFLRSGNKNVLTEENQQKILGLLRDRKDVDYEACVVPNAKIAENDYMLSVTTYVEAEDTTEAIDINQLNAEIEQIVARQAELRTKIDAIVKRLEV